MCTIKTVTVDRILFSKIACHLLVTEDLLLLRACFTLVDSRVLWLSEEVEVRANGLQTTADICPILPVTHGT